MDNEQRLEKQGGTRLGFVRPSELGNRRVRLSLRSKGKVNVAALAESFGGGGHAHASGCTLEGPLPDAIALILDKLRNCIHSAG